MNKIKPIIWSCHLHEKRIISFHIMYFPLFFQIWAWIWQFCKCHRNKKSLCSRHWHCKLISFTFYTSLTTAYICSFTAFFVQIYRNGLWPILKFVKQTHTNPYKCSLATGNSIQNRWMWTVNWGCTSPAWHKVYQKQKQKHHTHIQDGGDSPC